MKVGFTAKDGGKCVHHINDFNLPAHKAKYPDTEILATYWGENGQTAKD